MRAMLVAVGTLILVTCTVADESGVPAISETVSAAVDATIQAVAISTAESILETPTSSSADPGPNPPPGAAPSTVIHCADCLLVAVERVIDGDTIDTSIGRVRFFGVDTPERGESCFSEATEFTTRLVGESVRLEDGPRLTDRFGRRLSYIYDASGNSVDVQIVAGGFGFAWTEDGQHLDLLIGLEQSARSNHAGCLWGGDSPGQPPVSSATPLPGQSPIATAVPADIFVDRNCGDFAVWRDAQDFFVAAGGPSSDPHRLDGDNDGIACEALSGAPSAPVPTATATTSGSGGSGQLFDPNGPDRDCGDFGRWSDAQAFFEAAGGPETDRHNLDGDRDGIVCESLLGAPSQPTPVPTVGSSGASARCRDGTLSYSRNRSGTCSHHGGVSVWF